MQMLQDTRVPRCGYTGVKTFTATTVRDREALGDRVTTWLGANGDLELVDRTATQSSDKAFHCLSIIVFFRCPATRTP